MWPFRKKTPATLPPNQISYSQLDITEHFGDNERLGPNDWIATTPLDRTGPDAQTMGLPAPDADSKTIYEVASKLSALRESVLIPTDGVYCPICHIANIQSSKLGTPCPKCTRPLLKFGWD